ncbi:MAG: 2,3-bisphosphoglycerate-independent phosphoglycerate mutase [Gemmatimonadota bacterium]
MKLTDLAALAQPSGEKIVLLVLDGLGGLPMKPGGRTELEAARTPNLDELAREGGCGLHEPVAPGVTPGSGPGHLSLFGFDPLHYRIGRGVLEALGIEFNLEPGDIAARGNFCTVDGNGAVTDRRAGRLPTEESARLCDLLTAIRLPGAELFVRPVKEHRFLFVIRSDEPSASAIADTDPEREGTAPLDVRAATPESEPAARIARAWVEGAREALAGEPRANMVLLRGFASLPDWPRFPEVFRLRPLAAAAYPMYRGVARLVGMEAVSVDDTPEALVTELQQRYDDFDFFFLHIKGTDKAGEDGDFEHKVRVIESVDAVIPRLREAGAGVLLVTGDHSTPARLRSHSWHPVPFLVHGGAGRTECAAGFGESECARGTLGLRRGCDLMPLAMARAGRLGRFGA